MTKVAFYTNDKDGFVDTFAFFPELHFSNKPAMRMCYDLRGEHSECDVEYIKECRNATEDEFTPLLERLESVGYNDLYIVNVEAVASLL